MKNSIAFPLLALTGIGGAIASPVVLPYCNVLVHRQTIVKHAKPKVIRPPAEVRYVSSPCVPMGVAMPAVDTQFAPVDAGEIPSWLGVTRHSYYGGSIGPISSPYPPITGGINISDTSGANVPEPATWMLSIVGFGAIGAAMRRRTQQVQQ